MSEYTEEDFNKQSKFNSAGEKINRLSYLWNEISTSYRRGDINGYQTGLDRIEMEVCSVNLKPTEKLKLLELKKQFTEVSALKVRRIKHYLDPDYFETDNNLVDWSVKLSKLWNILRKRERFLRFIEDARGLGASYKDKDGEMPE